MITTAAPPVLAALQDYYAKHAVLPSYATIGELAGIRAKSWVHKLVGDLRDEGFLDFTPDKRLKPGQRFFDRTLAERVRAGGPEQAPDVATEAITIDRHLIDHPSRTSLVRVKGDSMIGAGILEGDLAVVEWRSNGQIGDIVVAIIDDELTLKYLARDKRGYFLRAANPAYPPIRAQGKLEVSGVMIGLVRRL